ncbi:translocation/assembly module TamB domain-containing protein [Chitinophaga lutea]
MTTPLRKKIFRWITGVVLTLILLPFVLLLLLQLPPVQRFMRSKAETYLQRQLKTDVRIGGLRFSWWNQMTLENVYVGDIRKDTLLSSGELAVKYNLLGLIGNELNIHSVKWENAVVNIYRPANDSAFNYQFAIDAFSSPGAKEDTLIEESGTTLEYNIGNVSLDNIRIRFNDTLGGMLASVQLAKLETTPEAIRPESGVYHLKNLIVDGLQADVAQLYRPVAAAPPAADTDTSSTPLDLFVRDLSIRNTSWRYNDEAGGLATDGKIGKLALRKTNFNLAGELVSAESLFLEKTGATLSFRQPLDTAKTPEDTSASSNWKVNAGSIEVRETDFAMDDHTVKPLAYKDAVDYSHLHIKGLTLDVKDLAYSPDSTLAVVRKATLTERSGLELRRLEGRVRYTPQEAQLSAFHLRTAESSVDADIRLAAPSWSTISDQLGLLSVNADVRPSTLALKEALFFVPDMRSNTSLQPLWKKRLALHGKLSGSLAKLNIPGIEVKDNDGNYLYVSGDAYQVTDPDRLGADLSKVTLRSTRQGIASWLPPGTLPASMQLPNRLSLDGSIRGGMQQLRPNLALQTDMGNATLRGELAQFSDMQKIRYNLDLGANGLQLGRILGDTAMGNLTGAFKVKGSGTDPERLTADAGINIRSFTYNRYTYTGITVDAALKNGRYSAKGGIQDSSVSARFTLSGMLDSLHPEIRVRADLDKLDLFATNFTTSPLTVRSCLDAEVDNLMPRKLSGFAAIHKIQLADDKQLYAMDSILLKATTENGLQQLSLTGPFGYISANGDFNYQTFATAAGDLVLRHLERNAPVVAATRPESQWMQFSGSLSIPKSLRDMFPGIRISKPLTLNGRMDTDSAFLLADIDIPSIVYDSFRVDTLTARISADTGSMAANVTLGRLRHPQIPLGHTVFDVNARQGLLDWGLVMGRRSRPRYRLGGYVDFMENDSLLISLKKDLLLNRQEWNVAGDNKVLVAGGGLAFADIGLQRSGQELRLTTAPQERPGALPDVTILLKDFRLSTVTSLIEKDTALAEGISNGQFTISNLDQTPLIDGQLRIDSLTAMGAAVGTLNLTARTTAEKAVEMDATIKGATNDIHLSGTYADVMDLRLDIAKLDMQSVEPLTFGQASQLSGIVNGNMTLRGTMEKPEIRGSLHFEKVKARITEINSILQLPSEDLTLDETGLRFNQFVVADSSGNEAVINGRILTRDYERFQLQLELNAENFMALGPQATGDNDQLFYGPAYIDVAARIRGTLDLPRVEMDLKVREKSEVTIIIPEEEPGLADRAGVVEFIDPAMWTDTTLRLRDTVRQRVSGLKGFVFSGDITVTPQSTMRIIIDPTNGDYLEVKGNATLNLTMDPSSKMSLTGRYEIDDGKYQMSLNQLIKREFKIEKGSTIIWNGDPLSADVNITARYDVNAVAGDLVQDQIRSDDPAAGRYKQKVPVEVYLKITKELLKPDLAFELDMPEKDQGALGGVVYTRMKQINQVPSELNKQVMGLLVLGRFIGDNPFDQLGSAGGGAAEEIARKSVSKIVSQQLNNLAGSLIKGFDVNFDLESENDYNDQGTREENTNLKVDVSKRLFNDRLTVTVGSNIGLSGAQTQGQDASSIIGDVSAEYTLTPDGRYRLRAYQRNMTETVVQGQVVETGLTFMLVMDYNEFREIFARKKEEKKQERLRKEKDKEKK